MTEHAAQRRTTEPNYVLAVLDFFARMGSAEAIVHGERRYSGTVEDVLTGHPGVRAAAVIGVPDAERGEAVVAFVVRSAGAGVTGEQLHELVAGELSAAHAPREVRFVSELPVTHAGKVDKRALRIRYRHG